MEDQDPRAAVVTTTTPDAESHGPHGYTEAKSGYLRRLRLIEGQTRGLARMVADDVYCIDILTQIAATTSALRAVAMGLMKDHLEHCVADAARTGGPEAEAKFDEVMQAIRRLAK